MGDRSTDEVRLPFDTYRIHYGTTNPNGYDLTRIEFFFDGVVQVGQILSGEAIGPGSYVTYREGIIYLYFDAWRLANALTILQGEANLALYFVPDRENPDQEQGSEGGICHAS